MEDNIIVLNDEEGNEAEFELITLIEYAGDNYAILLPAYDDEAEDVIILRVEATENEGEMVFVSVDDERLLETVFEIFKVECKDEFNFID